MRQQSRLLNSSHSVRMQTACASRTASYASNVTVTGCPAGSPTAHRLQVARVRVVPVKLVHGEVTPHLRVVDANDGLVAKQT